MKILLRNLKLANVKLIAAFLVLFGTLSVIALSNTVTADQAGTVSNTISHSPADEELSSVLFSTNTSTSAETTSSLTEYVSPEFTADYAFNGLGLAWNGPETAGVTFWLAVDGTDWVEVPMMEHEGKDKEEAFVSWPIFAQGSRVRYKIIGADVSEIRNVRITYFDSTTPPEQSTLRSIAHRVQATLAGNDAAKVVSREEWGADESYRTWQPSYTEPQAFVIHHTAGGDGGDNSTATIRGIYYWHAVVLGWGDIGYNYIIDQDGTIYEGRYGGDGVIGAHAYDAVNDYNYNAYTVGVAVLGCFEATDGACGTTHSVNSAIKDSLGDLLANKAKLFSIDPQGETELFSANYQTIIGHQDVDQTYCPGSRIHEKLTDIRSLTAEKMAASTNTKPKYRAEKVVDTFSTMYTAGDTPSITTTYRNTGKYKLSPEEVVMQIAVDGKNKRQRIPLTAIIKKNEEGSIQFAWEALPYATGDYVVTGKLYRKGHVIKRSRFTTTVHIENPYSAKIIETSIPLAIQSAWQPAAKVTLRNTGTATWDESTTLMVNGEIVKTLSSAVEPGEKTTINFKLNTENNWEPGMRTLTIRLKHDTTRVQGSRSVHVVRVD